MVPALRTGGGGGLQRGGADARGVRGAPDDHEDDEADQAGGRNGGHPLEEAVLRALRVLGDAGQRHRPVRPTVGGPPEGTRSG